MIKISIITICLNSISTIERTIHSVLEQKLRPHEYIFVDGGSTDGTLQLLEKLKPTLEDAGINVKILDQKRNPREAGIPSAWNQGIAQAEGDVIALLNSDDYYAKETLATVSMAFENDSELDVFCGKLELVKPDGSSCGSLSPRPLNRLALLMPIPHPACFVAKKLYNRIGLYCTKYKISADYDFIWRCRRGNAKMQYTMNRLTYMEIGGLANSQRTIARNETLAIAMQYSHFPVLPCFAWLIRKITSR